MSVIVADSLNSNPGGKLHTLIDVFSKAFAQLGVFVAPEIIEEESITVHKVMTGFSRMYHSLDHVFGLLDPEDPIQTLAAVYHDIVHYHADLGYSPEIERVILPYLKNRAEPVTLISDPLPGDWVFQLALGLFGYQPGRTLDPEIGLNEFLSALFMLSRLQQHLEVTTHLQITVCIEATIPFREESAFYALANRIQEVNLSMGLGLGKDEIETMVKTAVTFANRDVKDFADPNISALINNTWKLLPERNSALRKGIYTTSEYSQALVKVENFMGGLRAEVIFHQYKNTPSMDVYSAMLKLARENLSSALHYLQIKLLSAAVLQALAEISGGDAPLALFLGDRKLEGSDANQKIGDFLPAPDFKSILGEDSRVLELLQYDYDPRVDLDLRNVSLSLFIYRNLRAEFQENRISAARLFLAGQMTAFEFLAGCHGTAVGTIARAIAAIVPTRRERLLEYVSSLHSE
jgi:hypothetical protein